MEITELLLEDLRKKARTWTGKKFDPDTRKQVQALLAQHDPKELIDCFYRDLEFGTAGLRGIMGVGTNRMNKYTVGVATQGLANYLLKEYPKSKQIKVVVGYDSRKNSRFFAEVTAGIFSANGIKVYLFDDLRPTPEISYAIRKSGCQCGVVITASHNTQDYNGYKAYWKDGAQLIPPNDVNTIAEVKKINIKDVKFKAKKDLIEIIGKDMDELYTHDLKTNTLYPELIERYHDVKIVFTPLHGSGVRLIPEALHAYGFTNIIHVPEQEVTDGEFPNMDSPDPEKQDAMKLAIKKAEETDADLILASDPDADRTGVAVKDEQGEWVVLNGNQTGILFLYYLIMNWKNESRSKKKYIVKTIVTTETIRAIAKRNGVKVYDVLTGFKWIADVIRKNEKKKTFIGGCEESCGYLSGDFVRDKDAVSTCCILAEAAVWAKNGKLSLYQLLQKIYVEYGYSKTMNISIVKEGESGAKEINNMMKQYRKRKFKKIAGSKVVARYDYLEIIMPVPSNVLQYVTKDGTKVTIRPSGTEPKIKFYFELHAKVKNVEEIKDAEKDALKKIEQIKILLGI